jgi:hypothetical protein
MLWAPGSVWKVFQLVRANFEQFGAGPVSWGGLTAHQAVRSGTGGLTALYRRSNRPGQSEQVFALCCIPELHCCICSGGVCCGSGELFVVFGRCFGGLRSLLELVCLGCVEPLPLPKGSETCSSSSELALCLSLAFDRLLRFLFICFFLFSFSLVLLHVSVLSMHSSRGRLRTMCGSRTDGWSLPCVMSD